MNTKFKVSENGNSYTVEGSVSESDIVDFANALAASKLKKGESIKSPTDIAVYLQRLLASYEHEVFGMVLLNSQNEILETLDLFRGSVSSASVSVREVVKEALKRNCSNAILYHNHPSGNPEPSSSDRAITDRIVKALDLVGEIKVLDHMVVSSGGWISFAERGLI